MPEAGAFLQLVELAFRELALFAAFGFLLGAVDTLAVDILWLRRGAQQLLGSRNTAELCLGELPPPTHPGRHAVFVPAWDEADVIGPMLAHAARQFAGQDYRLFIGCYPNDVRTIAEVDAMATTNANVERVICARGIMYQPHQAPTPL